MRHTPPADRFRLPRAVFVTLLASAVALWVLIAIGLGTLARWIVEAG